MKFLIYRLKATYWFHKFGIPASWGWNYSADMRELFNDGNVDAKHNVEEEMSYWRD